jgi:hypothetical protein
MRQCLTGGAVIVVDRSSSLSLLSRATGPTVPSVAYQASTSSTLDLPNDFWSNESSSNHLARENLE